MDYSKLSEINVASKTRVNDSALSTVEARRKYLATKQKLADSFKGADSKKIIDSAVEALKDSSPEHVIRALVSLLSKKDSAPKRKKYAEIKDSEAYKALKKKIKDEMLETETTEDAIEVVQMLLTMQLPRRYFPRPSRFSLRLSMFSRNSSRQIKTLMRTTSRILLPTRVSFV